MAEYSVTSNWTSVVGSLEQAVWVRDASAGASDQSRTGPKSTVLLRRPVGGESCEVYGK